MVGLNILSGFRVTRLFVKRLAILFAPVILALSIALVSGECVDSGNGPVCD